MGDNFLAECDSLLSLKVDILEKIGNNCLSWNQCLKTLDARSLTEVGDDFLRRNNSFGSFYCPKLAKVGEGFLLENKKLAGLKRKFKRSRLEEIRSRLLNMRNRGGIYEEVENSRSR